MTRPLVVMFPVASCTAYVDADLPSYSELFEKAWILRRRDGKHPAGFVRASELTYKERCDLEKEMSGIEE